MLSRKQQWRRVKSKKRSGVADFSLYDDLIKALHTQESSPARVSSEPQLHTHTYDEPAPHAIRAWSTANDLTDPRAAHAQHSSRLPPRRVRFTATVKVVLIPTREELSSSGLSAEMWWSDSDYSQFKRAAIIDLRGLIHKPKVECVEPVEVVTIDDVACSNDQLPSPYSVANLPSPMGVDAQKHTPIHMSDMRDVSTFSSATKEDCKKMLQNLITSKSASGRPHLNINEEVPSLRKANLHAHIRAYDDDAKVSQAVLP